MGHIRASLEGSCRCSIGAMHHESAAKFDVASLSGAVSMGMPRSRRLSHAAQQAAVHHWMVRGSVCIANLSVLHTGGGGHLCCLAIAAVPCGFSSICRQGRQLAVNKPQSTRWDPALVCCSEAVPQCACVPCVSCRCASAHGHDMPLMVVSHWFAAIPLLGFPAASVSHAMGCQTTAVQCSCQQASLVLDLDSLLCCLSSLGCTGAHQ